MKMIEVLELSKLYATIKDTKMPLKVSYKFARLMRQAQKEIEFYQKEFNAIIEEFASKDAEGNYVYTDDGHALAIKKGFEVECNQAIEDLQNLEVDLGNITFTIDELSVLEDLDLSITEIGCLMPLIKE